MPELINLTDSNIPEKVIPATVQRANYRDTLDYDFNVGDTIKFTGFFNGMELDSIEHTVSIPASSGKKLKCIVKVDFVEMN